MQSWLIGKAIQWFDPDAVALHASQGYETRYSKLLLRLSVIASDVLGKPILKLDVAAWLMHIAPQSWRVLLLILMQCLTFSMHGLHIGIASSKPGRQQTYLLLCPLGHITEMHTVMFNHLVHVP